MTKENLIKELKRLSKNEDTHQDHIDADELLLKYIDDNEISDAYDEIAKWYA